MTIDQQHLVDAVATRVRSTLEGEGSVDDWWHALRVWNMAKHLCEIERADFLVVELAALLHDIADWKFHNGDDTVGSRVAREILAEYEVESTVADHVATIISTMSFKGAGVPTPMATLEGKIVQDADRLDAIGAIGIARTFTYGGSTARPIYNPNQMPVMHETKEAYLRIQTHTINHFYEKLLLLKDRVNTDAAKSIAQERHEFMEQFLERFYREWEGRE